MLIGPLYIRNRCLVAPFHSLVSARFFQQCRENPERPKVTTSPKCLFHFLLLSAFDKPLNGRSFLLPQPVFITLATPDFLKKTSLQHTTTITAATKTTTIMSFSDLPNELLLSIVKYLEYSWDVSALCQTRSSGPLITMP
ncbi:hypothetical protein BJY00DRAFT_287423 [Aspergillus carlsbadensis]|nr:hypothetical protein BJY00DRAFT_287423 [Aspergillus carlsbadensis]